MKIKFKRATRYGFVEVTGIDYAPLVIAQYEDAGFIGKQWGVFHSASGMLVPRCNFRDRSDAVRAAKLLKDEPAWARIEITGTGPGDIKIPKDAIDALRTATLIALYGEA